MLARQGVGNLRISKESQSAGSEVQPQVSYTQKNGVKNKASPDLEENPSVTNIFMDIFIAQYCYANCGIIA